MTSIEPKLQQALAAHPRRDVPDMPGRTNDVHAGILVPVLGEVDPVVVLTERPTTLRRHAGEVCFPGGRPEPGDSDLFATASREAYEEIGLVGARLVGGLSSIPLLTSNHRLHPFVVFSERADLTPSPDEVARLVTYSLRELYGRPHIDGIPWTTAEGTDLAPVFETGGRLLFGATAYVLFELLVALAPAFDATVPPRVAGRYAWPDVLGKSG